MSLHGPLQVAHTADVFLEGRLGMAGALIGTFIGRALWGANYAAGWIMAILGTILLLGLYRMFARRSA